MKVLTFFNNKGGVGKTTLATNIASYLAIGMNERVLMIDADPQSNSTQMIIDEDKWEQLYSKESKQTTIMSYLAPISLGEATLDCSYEPLSKNENRFGIDLIPGHPRLAFMEDKLSENWSYCFKGEIGGFRITNWVNALSKSFEQKYDYIIFDVGPSLGVLNRSILLNSDYFVTPMGCDVFSLLGIENIAEWITKWKEDYRTSLRILERYNPNFDFGKYFVTDEEGLERKIKFAGYSVQQYITKVIRGERRGISAYERILNQIPAYIEANLKPLIPEGIDLEQCNLGEIPHYYSLVPLAQTSKTPIHQLRGSDGIVGGQYSMVKDYAMVMDRVCHRILNNMGERK